ncbi:uncharacterized protein LOC101761377 isoform X3 [Setaria italica]|uniref:uncharacterized protein LOC101761377 isoform X3 n=1 Tax=Setaria italica TaxID=4555 RepID=UPI000BE55179|nr:uncharacterized protein LOC101761377 isoform X3 [Setaria italica]
MKDAWAPLPSDVYGRTRLPAYRNSEGAAVLGSCAVRGRGSTPGEQGLQRGSAPSANPKHQIPAASSIICHHRFPYLPPPPPSAASPSTFLGSGEVLHKLSPCSLVPAVSGGIPHSSVHAVRRSVEPAAPGSQDRGVAGHAAKEHQLMNLIHHAEVEVAVDVKNKGCVRDAA